MQTRQRFPNKFDWYVFGEVIGPFLGGLIFFSFVFLMFQILRLADFFIIHGVSGWLLGKMTLLLVLSFLPAALPVAFLISILIGFGRLSSDSELVAMKASGVSIWRLTAPALALALMVSTVSLFLNMEWCPWGENQFKITLFKVSNTKVVSSIKAGTFTDGFFDLLIYADKVDSRTNRMEGVFIYDEREPRNPLTVVANQGEIVSIKPSSALGTAVVMKLFNGNIHRNNSAENSYQKIDFREYRLFLKIDEGQDTGVPKPRMYSYADLQRDIKYTEKRDPRRHIEMKAEFWRRISTAISPLFFVFLGIGFGTIRTRSVRSGAALAAFVVVFTYYGLQGAGTMAAQNGLLSPFLAMQLPNIVTAIAAYFGFRSATW